jgi:predicted enzyme related to lactoylglutathione lyase
MTDAPLPALGFYKPLEGSPETAVNVQTTIDCDDPHAQARFWAAALGWSLEDPHDFVKAVLAAGYATQDDVVEHDGRLSWRTMTAIQHPDDLEKPRGTGRRVLFQHVPDRTPGKNAWHFDLNVGRQQIDEHVARLTSLGASELYRVDEPSGFHTTMSDPEGNLFCVQ